MGAIIKVQDITSNNIKGLLRPIIYCNPSAEMITSAKPINEMLAELLIKYKASRRTIQMEKCFNQILFNFPDEVIIKDFDVMFNPTYKVDVLKIMIAAYKKKPFSIIWPGKCDNGKLLYAEEGYSDYKIFIVEDYDVTCII